MKRIYASCLLLLAPICLIAQNQAPEITNLTLTPDWANLTLDISYDVSDNENDPLEIALQFSDNGGKTYALTGQIPVTGDVGFPIQPGNRSISCDITTLANSPASFTVRLVADDKQLFDIQA